MNNPRPLLPRTRLRPDTLHRFRIGSVTKSAKRRPTKQVISQSVKADSSIADTAPVKFLMM